MIAHHRPCVVLRVMAEKAIDRSRAAGRRPSVTGSRTDGGWCAFDATGNMLKSGRVELSRAATRIAEPSSLQDDNPRRARTGAAWVKFELEVRNLPLRGLVQGLRSCFQGWDTGNLIRVALCVFGAPAAGFRHRQNSSSADT